MMRVIVVVFVFFSRVATGVSTITNEPGDPSFLQHGLDYGRGYGTPGVGYNATTASDSAASRGISCTGWTCSVENQYCPPGRPGAGNVGYRCCQGEWRSGSGECSNEAYSCQGWTCSTENQYCPPGRPGSSPVGYRCCANSWQRGSDACSCQGWTCNTENQYCPPGRPGSGPLGYRCCANTWQEGNGSCAAVAQACSGWSCNIENQACPAGAPGSGPSGYRCCAGQWRVGLHACLAPPTDASGCTSLYCEIEDQWCPPGAPGTHDNGRVRGEVGVGYRCCNGRWDRNLSLGDCTPAPPAYDQQTVESGGGEENFVDPPTYPIYCKKYTLQPKVSVVNVCSGTSHSYIEAAKTYPGAAANVAVTISGKISWSEPAFAGPPDGGSVTIERTIELKFPDGLKWLANAVGLEVTGKIGAFIGMAKGSEWGLADVDILVYGGCTVKALVHAEMSIDIMGGIKFKDFNFSTMKWKSVDISVKILAQFGLGPFNLLCTVTLLSGGQWKLHVDFKFVAFDQLVKALANFAKNLAANLSRALQDTFKKVADAFKKAFGWLSGWR